jgi:hypothetical protein
MASESLLLKKIHLGLFPFIIVDGFITYGLVQGEEESNMGT